MKGFKLIAGFSALILLSYMGVLFVEANREEVIVTLGTYQTAPAPLGFVVMTSVLVGMVIGGLLCSLELIYLFFRSQSLQRQLKKLQPKSKAPQTKNGPAKNSLSKSASSIVSSSKSEAESKSDTDPSVLKEL